MDDATRQSLIDKLAEDKKNKFVGTNRYSIAQRKWFIEKLLDYFLDTGVKESKVEREIKKKIEEATTIFNDVKNNGLSTGGLDVIWTKYVNRRSKAQIVYDLLATHPEFFDSAHEDYRNFIIERRYRCIERMNYYVNPNERRKVFAYPDRSLGEPTYRLNTQAASYWESYLTDADTPFVLSASGSSNPTTAIEKLFESNSNRPDRNLMFCDMVAFSLLVDSLLAAKDSDTLLTNLATNEGSSYVRLDHPYAPNGFSGVRLVSFLTEEATSGTNAILDLSTPWLALFSIPTQTELNTDSFIDLTGSYDDLTVEIVSGDHREVIEFDKINHKQKQIRVTQLNRDYPVGARIFIYEAALTVNPIVHVLTDDRSAKTLFEQKQVTSDELMVGDHIYILNHPLYQTFYTGGPWTGEHAFIMGMQGKTQSELNQMLVAGHGLSSSLVEMSNHLLGHMNTKFSMIQAVLKIHLANVKKNGNVTSSDDDVFVTTTKFNTKDFDIYQYGVFYDFDEWVGVNSTTNTVETGFAMGQEVGDDQQIYIFNLLGVDPTENLTIRDYPLRIKYDSADPFNSTNRFKLSNWKFEYFSIYTGQYEQFQLFDLVSGVDVKQHLTQSDLALWFDIADPDKEGVLVTRPFVSFDPSYLTYLSTNGAI